MRGASMGNREKTPVVRDAGLGLLRLASCSATEFLSFSLLGHHNYSQFYKSFEKVIVVKTVRCSNA